MEHNNTNNNMEGNFPIIKINWFDKMYKKLVLSLTNKLDNGQIFKTIIVSLFHLLSFAFLFGGIIFLVAALFGDYGYIESLKTLNGGKKILGILGLIIGIPIGLFMSWFLYSLIRKRAHQLEDKKYGSIITFIFESASPSIIILLGEVIAAVAIMSSLLQLIATLLNSMAYAPIIKLIGFLTGDDYASAHFAGSYEYLNYSLGMQEGGALFMLVGGVVILIVAYAFRDIYNYLYTLALRVLNPVLYFAVAGILGFVTFALMAYFVFGGMYGGMDFEDFGWLAIIYVGLILIYTLLMLLKKYVYVNKSNN